MKPEANLPPLPIAYRMMDAVLGHLLKKLGMSCRDAYILSSRQMDRELTKSESIRLHFHLSMCRLCHRLPAQFRGMRSLIQACEHDHSHEETSDESMTPEAKQRISEALKSQQKP